MLVKSPKYRLRQLIKGSEQVAVEKWTSCRLRAMFTERFLVEERGSAYAMNPGLFYPSGR